MKIKIEGEKFLIMPMGGGMNEMYNIIYESCGEKKETYG